MPNVELTPLTELSSFRRLALGQWSTTYDPTIYGSMSVRMEKALEYIEAFRKRTGKRLTVTHLVAKAVAEALHKCPEANAILRYNRIWLRKSVDLSVLVVQTDEGAGKVDLAAAKLVGADKRSLYDLAIEIEQQVQRVRDRKDAAMEQGKGTIQKIPLWLMHRFLKLVAWLTYTLNLDLSGLGIPRDPFGSATITNIGSLGLDTGFVPLVPTTRVPIFVAPGAIREVAVVDNGQVVPGKIMNICASMDHRFIDGFHASVLAKTVRACLEDPFNNLDRIESLPEAAAANAATGAA